MGSSKCVAVLDALTCGTGLILATVRHLPCSMPNFDHLVAPPLLPRAHLHAAFAPYILLVLIKNFVPLALDSVILVERILPLWSCACLALLYVNIPVFRVNFGMA